MGGRPSKGTSKDRRLSGNRGGTKKVPRPSKGKK
jgi:hypothetical protein